MRESEEDREWEEAAKPAKPENPHPMFPKATIFEFWLFNLSI